MITLAIFRGSLWMNLTMRHNKSEETNRYEVRSLEWRRGMCCSTSYCQREAKSA